MLLLLLLLLATVLPPLLLLLLLLQEGGARGSVHRLTCQHVPDFYDSVLQASGQQQPGAAPPGGRARSAAFGGSGPKGQAPHWMAAAKALVFAVGLAILRVSGWVFGVGGMRRQGGEARGKV